MEPTHCTPRSRFSSTLGSMGTPARRAPSTPLSARHTLGRSTRAQDWLPSSANKVGGTPKNIFRASMTADRTRHTFTPRASSSLRQTFSPAPPSSVRSFRGPTAPTTTHTSAPKSSLAHLFNQTIDDPPTSLDGEALMNQVPDDSGRQGSVYADEFLAHTCPPGLDDLGRRQWFCILDLRRLKYAANELFAKKDWKLNVTNFAKEYEKSRGLIMLRYGLYEFQTVKPSDDQVRKWRKDHDIPDPDEDDSPARRAQTGASKRKAEDDMPLAASTSKKNKRRLAEPTKALANGKRRATSDSDQDENQPTKMQKTNTPSQSLSAFMKAAAGSTNSQATPTKPASSVPVKASTKSVFDTIKVDHAHSPNPFEHLSDASRGASAVPSSESGEDSDGDDTEEKDASEPSISASGGVGTPADREGTPSQSFFDRVTKDDNGQPLRVLDAESDKPQPAGFTPSNQTWSTSTPIKFSGTSSTPFAPKLGDEAAAQPAPFKAMFGAKKVEETALLEAKIEIGMDSATIPSSTLSVFKPAESAEAAKPSVSTFFSAGTSAQPPTPFAAAGLFGSATGNDGTKMPAATASFGNGTAPVSVSSMFGAKTTEPATFVSTPSNTTEKVAAPAFGPVASLSSEASKPAFGASSTSAAPAVKSIFPTSTADVKPVITFGAASVTTGDQPTGSMFGSTTSVEPPTKKAFGAAPVTTGDQPTGSMFGSTPSVEPPTKKAFGAPVVSIFNVGAKGDEKPKTSLFGGSSQPVSSLFGGTAASSMPAFGASAPASDSGDNKAMGTSFGVDSLKPTAAATETKSMFDFARPNASQPALLFGEKKSDSVPSNLFKAAAQTQSSSAPAASQSGTPTTNTFSFGAASSGSNPFGSQNGAATSGASINFDFAAKPAESKPNSSFSFGVPASNPPVSKPMSTPTATSMFNFAGPTPATPPAPLAGPPFTFTSATPTGNVNNMFAPQPGALAAPGGTSTGNSSPFNLGGASSLATTPAATTPEPTTAADEGSSKQPAGGQPAQKEEEENSAQISLTEGGPGEEDEEVMYDVRCKALKEELEAPNTNNDSESEDKKKSKSAWSTKGLGPLRILKHKTTGAVRLVMRAEPRGNVVVNSVPIAGMPYTVSGKYVVAAFPSENGGLEKWMLMVKTTDAAKALADAINKFKTVVVPE